MSDNNKEEPFLLSDYQMYQIRKLTKQLEEIHDTIRARNNFYNRILHAFGNPYPIKETHKQVFHVSGFKPIQMYKILFSQGLKWKKDKGIYYNTEEYGYRPVTLIGRARGYKPKKEHVSELHSKENWLAPSLKIFWIGPFWFRVPRFMLYLKKYGILPLNVTYVISTDGLIHESYEDENCMLLPHDNGEEYSIFRYVKQDCIPPQYIRLKAITFALPILGWYKVLWRRKSD